jgi:hypothetical protein
MRTGDDLWRLLLRTPVAAAMVTLAASSLRAEESAAGMGDRLDFMKTSVATYVVMADGQEIKLNPEPLLRWDNPVSKVPDGTLFLWQDAKSRPKAIVQVFIAANTKDLWLHEFQSLSTSKFEMFRNDSPVWTPDRGGVDWKPLPDAPSPGGTRIARLTQMRQLAKRFEAQDDFEGKSRWDLRLLSTPLHRYGADGEDVIDGAIFAYAHGTDPEALLLLEARPGQGGAEWNYALAPMTGYALRVSDQGKEVWTIDKRPGPYVPSEPFFLIKYVP